MSGVIFGRVFRGRLPAFTAVVLAATVSAAPTMANAQSVGEGPLVLRLPASARAASMANVGIASNDGDAMFYNPGMLASSRGTAISLQSFGEAATAGSMATTSTSGSLTLGIGAQYLSYAVPTGTSYADAVFPGATHLSDGGNQSASSTALTFGVARTVKGLRLGVAAKFVEDRVGAAHDATVAFDVGFNRQVGRGTLGIAVQNLGTGLRIDGIEGVLPLRFGVGYGFYRAITSVLDIGAQTAVTLESDSFVRPAGGLELAYVPIDGVTFTIRQGFRLPREQDESLYTAGLGLTVDRFSFDYAMDPVRGGRPVSHRIGVRVR